MRKLVVVMLTVGSLLLLEAPAVAPHLYKLSSTSGGVTGGKRWFGGETDCPNSVKVIFVDDRLGTAPSGALNATTQRRTIRLSTTITGSNRPDVKAAYCGGVLMTLPMTGVSALHKLAFAALLLVAGVVLLILGRSPTRTGPGHRRAGAGPS